MEVKFEKSCLKKDLTNCPHCHKIIINLYLTAFAFQLSTRNRKKIGTVKKITIPKNQFCDSDQDLFFTGCQVTYFIEKNGYGKYEYVLKVIRIMYLNEETGEEFTPLQLSSSITSLN